LRALVFMRCLLPGSRGGDGATVLDPHHIVGERGHVGLVVGNEEDRQAEPRLQLAQLVAQPHAQRRVERGERLVEEQRARLGGERAGERGALALAARELVG
jgi:hypothetical protein